MTLQPPYIPDGFDDFWLDAVREAKKVGANFRRTPQNEVVRDGFTIDLLQFESVGGRSVEGWFAFPTRRLISPGFLWLAPYGRWSMLPNEYGTREYLCSLSFNFHGEAAFHREDYRPERGYLTEGIDRPETWVFRRMFQDCVVAAAVLQAQEECNAQQVGAMGMSQGGGMAVWLAAFLPSLRAVVADMPFGAARPLVFERDIARYPLKEISDYMAQSDSARASVMRTLSFYDTVNFAARCKAPTLLTYGTKDPAVREYEVRSVYEALVGEKSIEAIDGGHDWHESMVERNRQWLLDHF